MTTRIYVTSAEGGTGKSTVALGLLEELTRTVDRVGVFRPIARDESHDYILELLLSRASAELEYAECVGVGYAEVHDDLEGALARIVERFAAIESRCDAVVIMGSDYTDVGSPTELGVNGRIAADLAATAVAVVRGQRPDDDAPRSPEAVAEAAALAVAELHAVHAEVAAVIANRVEPDAVDAVREALTRTLPEGVGGWAIPEDPVLVAPLLRDVFAATDAELLRGDAELLERPVTGTVVAAMSLENVLPRLLEGAVVVVPGDRSDVLVGTVVAHLSQTYPSLAGILLNGGFPVAPAIAGVLDGLDTHLPVARTELGTFDTSVRLSRVHSRLAADSPQKLALALGLFERHVDGPELVRRLKLAPSDVMTPARFEHSLVQRARADRRHIVLPEGDDDRILRAAGIVVQRGIARLTILGDEAAVRSRAAELGVDLGDTAVLSTDDPELHPRFAEEYQRLRAHKGMTPERAAETVLDVSYFGTMMVYDGLADGMVSGAAHTTAHTIRPSFETIKTSPGVSVVSSVFLMALADRVLVYGDCAVIPEPTAEQLADIAISSAATARRFGVEPRVAMLSYSTGESGSGAEVEKVRAATALVRERAPELPVAGPIQYDAAADPDVGRSKMPGSDVAGRATVFVFPDLNTGNNTYKAVQRSAGAVAIGPVLQGLAKPVNDLSRGALVRDIVNTIAITAIQAQGETAPSATGSADAGGAAAATAAPDGAAS
ncbi:MAG: phosphate acetyltransferase [Actinomycetales bacterium]|nr:phosphate acetyltransferase [Actinomycetales bacterium]